MNEFIIGISREWPTWTFNIFNESVGVMKEDGSILASKLYPLLDIPVMGIVVKEASRTFGNSKPHYFLTDHANSMADEVITRPWKHEQIKLINSFHTFASEDEVKDYITQPVLTHDEEDITSGRWISKPATAARGLGQVIFEPRTDLPLGLILKGIQDMDKVAFRDLLQKTEDPTLPLVEGATFIRGFEYEPGESFVHLKPLILNHYPIITPYVENIVAEFRALFVGGRMVYVQPRELVPFGGSHKLARGAIVKHEEGVYKHEGVYDVLQNKAAKVGLNFSDASVRLLKRFGIEANLLLGSADLFITSDNKWGIFEYSTEFGREGISEENLCGVKASFIAECHRRYLLETNRINILRRNHQ